jgi:hypothetical protein
MCRRFFFFLFLVVIGLAAGFLYYVHETSTPHVFPNPKLIPAREAQAAQDRLEQALGLSPGSRPKARTAANSSSPATGLQPGQTITIHLSEDDINTTIATNPDIKQQLAAHGVQAAQLAFAPPNIVTAFVKIVYHDQPADAEVMGALSPDSDGGLQFAAQEVKVSDVPVPLKSAQPIIDKAEAILLPKADSGLPIRVQTIDVRGKVIYLTGPAKKRID